ncbi:MAG TPA: hypothetical protein VF516_24445 [Kofleriaceae bacterium]
MNRQPRDHGADRGEPAPPAGAEASLHPRFRPALRGHIARRHLRPAADPPPPLPV